jgi:hypothetical protein
MQENGFEERRCNMTKQEYLESKGLEIHGHNLLEEVDYEIQDMIEECEDSEV